MASSFSPKDEILFLRVCHHISNAQSKNVPSSAEEVLQNTPVKRLKVDNPITGLPSGKLETPPREFSITFKPQCKDNKSK